MKKGPWFWVFVIMMITFVVAMIVSLGSIGSAINAEPVADIKENSILHLKLEDVIVKPKKLLDALRKHRKNDNVKAVLIEINSPGGDVGPSQELYTEIKRTREEYNKPVVAYSGALMASGAFYAAMGASQIVTAPGTLMGSVGVIMSFVNLSELYDWAKMEPYAIKTGKFKDAGAPYKPMSEEEEKYFQALVDEVLDQFRAAIIEGRGLEADLVEEYADGRVWTGQKGVELGFADSVGTLTDAIQLASELAELGDDYHLVEPPKKTNFMELLTGEAEGVSFELKKWLDLRNLNGRPLYLMPGSLP